MVLTTFLNEGLSQKGNNLDKLGDIFNIPARNLWLTRKVNFVPSKNEFQIDNKFVSGPRKLEKSCNTLMGIYPIGVLFASIPLSLYVLLSIPALASTGIGLSLKAIASRKNEKTKVYNAAMREFLRLNKLQTKLNNNSTEINALQASINYYLTIQKNPPRDFELTSKGISVEISDLKCDLARAEKKENVLKKKKADSEKAYEEKLIKLKGILTQDKV